MLIIIPCGAKKRPGLHPAADLYIGPYYRSCLATARRFAPDDAIRILSGKYGLLRLETEIVSYDTRLGGPGSISPEKIVEQGKRLREIGRVVALCGERYASVLRRIWPELEQPLRGIGGIGKQMAALKRIRKDGNL